MTCLVIVERRFDRPVAFADVQLRESAVAWCLEMYGVRFLRTYLAKDGMKMVCLYEAPDAEAVRKTQEQGNLPYCHVWTAQTLGDRLPVVPAPMEAIVMQRTHAQPATPACLTELAHATSDCFALYRVSHLTTHLSLDGLHRICVFASPDAESMRQAEAAMQPGIAPKSTSASVWNSSIHEP